MEPRRRIRFAGLAVFAIAFVLTGAHVSEPWRRRAVAAGGNAAQGRRWPAYREADGQRVMAKTFGRTLTPAQLRTSLHFCSRAGKEPLGVA